jgi:hypothetical protein
MDVKIQRKNYGQGAIEFVVDGQLEDINRFGVICTYLQAERLDDLADVVKAMAKRNAETMTTLVSALGDLTAAVAGLREDIQTLGEEGIKARLNQEIERAGVLAMETLGGLKG